MVAAKAENMPKGRPKLNIGHAHDTRSNIAESLAVSTDSVAVASKILDRANVGDVVEVKCFSITAKDKFREPRFVRVRTDKKEVA